MALGEGTKAVIREIAREVIAENHKHLEKEMAEKIELHAAQCTAKKYTNGKNFISAIIGGTIVGIVGWLLGKR